MTAQFHTNSPHRPQPACSVQVQQVWAGELFDERCFAQPMRVTLGPLGTFVLPPLAGASAAVALLEPFQGGFGLRIDSGDGWFELAGIRHSFAELRQFLAPLAHAPVVQLCAGAKAQVCWGAFCFEIAAVDLPVHDHEPLHWRHAVPLALALVVATASTVGPLVCGLAMPSDQAKWRVQVQEELKISEVWPIEIAVPEPVPLPPAELTFVRKQPGPAESPPLAPTPRMPRLLRPYEPPTLLPTKVQVHATVQQTFDRLGLPKPVEQGGTLALGTPDAGQPTAVVPELPPETAARPHIFGEDDTQEQAARPYRELMPSRTVVLSVKPPQQHVIPPLRPQVSHEGLSAADVGGVLREHHGLFKRCFQIGKQQQPDLQGRLVLTLVIGPLGQVLDSRVVDSDLDASGVEVCVATAAKELRFPPASDGQPTKVRYPLVMRSN